MSNVRIGKDFIVMWCFDTFSSEPVVEEYDTLDEALKAVGQLQKVDRRFRIAPTIYSVPIAPGLKRFQEGKPE